MSDLTTQRLRDILGALHHAGMINIVNPDEFMPVDENTARNDKGSTTTSKCKDFTTEIADAITKAQTAMNTLNTAIGNIVCSSAVNKVNMNHSAINEGDLLTFLRECYNEQPNSRGKKHITKK